MFDGAAVVPHLVRRGLVTAAEGARSRPAVERVPGRNLLYRVAFDSGATFLLKQAVDPETRRSLDREARMYDHLAGCADRALGSRPLADRALAGRLPRKLDYDPDTSVIVLEFLAGYRPLAVPPDGGRHPHLEPRVAAELGRALSELSSLPPPPFDSTVPWVLSLVHPPVAILREATPGILDLTRTIQRSPAWCRCLERLSAEWSASSVVHGDLRFSNVLIRSGRIAARRSELAIVDWELAGPGDAGWDAGCAIAGFLARRHGRAGAAFPLLRAFWSAYIEGSPEMERTEQSARLDVALAWAAAALLQIAYEAARAHPPHARRIERLVEIGRSLIERSDVWAESVFLPRGEAAWPTPAR